MKLSRVIVEVILGLRLVDAGLLEYFNLAQEKNKEVRTSSLRAVQEKPEYSDQAAAIERSLSSVSPEPTPTPTVAPTASAAPTITLLPLAYITAQANASSPLGRCQGDCDYDGHCQGALECFRRSRKEPVPGCSGEGLSGIDYCYEVPGQPAATPAPTPQPTGPTLGGGPQLTYPGDNGVPEDKFPLKRCEGDCDGDEQCDGDLVCFHRPNDTPVPGCSGSGIYGKDYCIRPEDAPPPSHKRIRLYWEYGYFWQETHREMFFCWVAFGNGEIRIDRCNSGNTEWEFVFLAGDGDQIRQRGTNQCVELTGSRTVELRTCDASDDRQRWVSERGSFLGQRFDIRPLVDKDRCLSQHHHPKPYEEVYAETCDLAHGHKTGFWEFY